MNNPDSIHSHRLEWFTVTPVGAGACDSKYTINTNQYGSTKVTTDGGSTTYTHYDPTNNLTDVETVSGNTISSTMYDPQTQTILGIIKSTYYANGYSRTTYRLSDGTLTRTEIFDADSKLISNCGESTAATMSTPESLLHRLASNSGSGNVVRSRTIAQILQFGCKTKSESDVVANTRVNYVSTASYW